jgi:uncharacterized membrane protein
VKVTLNLMKNNSTKAKVDPKLHMRKKTAGLATGAIIGATVAGPIGALVGGAIGTFVGDAAEDGAQLPKGISNRLTKSKLGNLAGRKVTPKRSTSSVRKKSAAPRSKRAAAPKSRTKKKK